MEIHLRKFSSILVLAGLLATLLAASPVGWAEADVDCAMCHDTVLIPDGHMPVDEMSVASCTMCHESSGKDPFFKTVHQQHGDALGCDGCHSDVSDTSKARLKELLGQ